MVVETCSGVDSTATFAEKIAEKIKDITKFGISNYSPRWLALDDPVNRNCDCENGRYLALLSLEILGFPAARMELDQARPSTDTGTADYPSDCSDIESSGGLDLFFSEDNGVPGSWSIAECLFKLQEPGGYWQYTSVWGRHGPVRGEHADPAIARKKGLYLIMDDIRNKLGGNYPTGDYIQGWGQVFPPAAPGLP
jgi:hypothetical protein